MERNTVEAGTRHPRFAVGQIVRHREYGFRGVIIDVHGEFRPQTGWAAPSPPELAHQPWYELLIHDTNRVAYVAEEGVEHDFSCLPVAHPLVRVFFTRFRHGRYELEGPAN